MMRTIADMIGFGRQYVRSTVTMFFTFVFPILLVVLFGAIFSNQSSQTIQLHVQDLDEGPYSTTLISLLNDTDLFKIEMIPLNENISSYVKNESLTTALLIPNDFSTSIVHLMATGGTGTANLTIMGDPSQSSFRTVEAALSVVVDQMNYVVAGSRPYISYGVETVGSEKFEFMDFFLPGIVGMTVMITAMYTMTSTCSEYKSRGYFKLLATTSLRKTDWLISKFLFYFVVLLLSLLITFAVGNAMYGTNATLTPMSVVLIFAGTFLFTSMGMLLGSAAKDPEAGAAVSNAIGFPMMFLSGTFFEIDSMPLTMQIISRAMPLTYLNDGLRDTMVYGNTASALVNLGIVAMLGVVFFFAASKFMSWKER